MRRERGGRPASAGRRAVDRDRAQVSHQIELNSGVADGRV